MTQYPDTVKNLISQISRLPSLGPKSAERIVFYLLKQGKRKINEFSDNLKKLVSDIKICQTCGNIDTVNPCRICLSKERNKKTICVVAEPQDILIIEKTGEFKGLYHVLGGVLNPIENITPDRLNISKLLKRIKSNAVREVIIATNPDIEGESTALYLARQLRPVGIKITRLAKGMPMGSTIEYADEITISNALKGRQEI